MSQDLGNGFVDHGVATPISNHRGTVATVDGDGRNVVLVWLFDHRGGYALLLIDAETGHAEEFATPFAPERDCPFASLLSSANRYYTHFGSHFLEFDPAARAFTFCRKTAPRMAMSMTEDDAGVIWSATYPDSGVVSYNPAGGDFTDYGSIYRQDWMQYPRHVAADDAGWVYVAVGFTAGQIIILDREGGAARPVLAADQRAQGGAYVYRDEDGKVYGLPLSGADGPWYGFHAGEVRKLATPAPRRAKPIIAGSQALFHREFPDGRRLRSCDLVERTLTVEDPATGQVAERRFDYSSEGAHVMGLAAASDGTICGGTAFPMRFFSYDPEADAWTNRAGHGQWNTVARQGDRFFVGGYIKGFLLEWDPARPWAATEVGDPDCNPRHLTECHPAINRPHCLLAHGDGRTVVMAGTPGYGYTGGGVLFWDRQTGSRTLLEHTAIIPEHATMSLAPLPGGKLLGGTTTSPGTGGQRKADEAELFVLDMATKRVEWHEPLLAAAAEYTDLWAAPGGLVYGFADRRRFFVFDPADRRIVHEADTEAAFGPTIYHQGPRVFVPAPDGEIYVLFVKGIARIDPATHAIAMLAESPVPIGPGGDILDGRIYFAAASRLCSYRLPDRRQR